MATPSITYLNFRAIFNRKIGDIPYAVTTTSAGADTTYDTAISTALREYYTSSGGRDLFVDWWCYYPYDTASIGREERRIEAFDPETGTLKFYRGFSARVATAINIEIHKHQPSRKLLAINEALRYVRKDGFFNPSYDETLWGQEAYGEPDEEFNKREYTVPTAFEEFPDRIVLLDAYTGTHTGDDDEATVLTDANQSWKTNELVGFRLYNKTDGSYGTVTSNTSTTATVAALSGPLGTEGDDWDTDDEYIIQKPYAMPNPLLDYDIVAPAEAGAFKFYAHIPENYLIKLVGKGALTAFTTEASTTELYDWQADIVADKAAQLWFEYLADAGIDSDKARANATRHLGLYEAARSKRQLANQNKLRMNWKW